MQITTECERTSQVTQCKGRLLIRVPRREGGGCRQGPQRVAYTMHMNV